MSRVLEIIDLEGLGLPQPETIFQLAELIHAKAEERPRPNPKYVELARRLVQIFPTAEAIAAGGDPDADESVWLGDPVEQAKRAGAVWGIQLPGDRGLSVVHAAVEAGRELGLTMLLDSMGVAFLPDGRVLPEERQEEWDLFMEFGPEEEAPAKEKRPTLPQLRKKLRVLFEQRLAPHGFGQLPLEDPTFPVNYRRPVDVGGWQQVTFVADRHHDDFCLPYVLLSGQCARVHQILLAALGPAERPRDRDYTFFLTTLAEMTVSRIYVNTLKQIDQVLELLEQAGLPMLDQARTVAGLDRMYSHAPENVDWLNAKRESFTALICAYLTGNPSFLELEQQVREFVKRYDKTPDHPYRTENLDRLLAYLRDHVKPLDR